METLYTTVANLGFPIAIAFYLLIRFYIFILKTLNFIAVANLGFPIAIAFYLLIRIEGKLETLTTSINNLSINIEKFNKN